MSVTPIDKDVGYALKSVTIGANGTVLAQFTVGTIATDGSYKEIAEKNYMLSADEAAPILNTPSTGTGTVYDGLSAALAANLSLRPDWIV